MYMCVCLSCFSLPSLSLIIELVLSLVRVGSLLRDTETSQVHRTLVTRSRLLSHRLHPRSQVLCVSPCLTHILMRINLAAWNRMPPPSSLDWGTRGQRWKSLQKKNSYSQPAGNEKVDDGREWSRVFLLSMCSARYTSCGQGQLCLSALPIRGFQLLWETKLPLQNKSCHGDQRYKTLWQVDTCTDGPPLPIQPSACLTFTKTFASWTYTYRNYIIHSIVRRNIPFP